MDAYVAAHSIRAISAIDGVEVGTYHFVWGGSQMVTWMPTWYHILDVRLGTCVESWVKQKARPSPTRNISPQ